MLGDAKLVIDGPGLDRSAACEPILRALPQWFGIEKATRQYIEDIATLPTFLAFLDDELVGFLTLKPQTAYAAEIHVMGILPDKHRQGVGSALVKAAQEYLLADGMEYLQVKTLSASHPDGGYARTRMFYLALGFRPLQEFPELWDRHSPCLQMVKWLGRT